MNQLKFHIVSLGIILSLNFISCNHKADNSSPSLRNVVLTEVETSGDISSKNFAGVVEEGSSVNAAFMTGGKISSRLVKEGDRVKKGQMIASLDDTDYLIGVNQLQVQYDQMVSEKKRMDEMYARHNIAPNDYEKFETGFRQLELQLDMAKNKLGYTKLYSPINGFIAFKYMEPGELVDAGTPIYKITDDSNMTVTTDLPLSIYLNRDRITATYGSVPNIMDKIPLKIESFTPDADNNQLYHMKLNVPRSYSGDLTKGMNMEVVIEMNNDLQGETMVPSRSLFENEGLSYVWIFNEKDSTISKKQISVSGAPQGSMSMVKGLAGKEKIVAAGVKQLKEGEKVKVVPNPIDNNK